MTVNPIFKNRWFYLGTGVAVVHQLLVALETYLCIKIFPLVLSPEKRTVSSLGTVITAILMIQLATCLLKSVEFWNRTKLAHFAWQSYVVDCVTKLSNNTALGTRENKRLMAAWMGGESFTTLKEAGKFFMDAVGLYVSLFTIPIAMLCGLKDLGLPWSVAWIFIAPSIISLCWILLFRRRFSALAGEVQSVQASAIGRVCALWDTFLFKSTEQKREELSEAMSVAHRFFKTEERYKLYEQSIASFPIVLVLFGLMWLVFPGRTSLSLDQLVALFYFLDKGVKLLQKAHAISGHGTLFLLMKQKLNNLDSFIDQLKSRNLWRQISLSELTVKQSLGSSLFTGEEFVSEMTNRQVPTAGRYTIQGRNGAGKSSFLKWLKLQKTEAMFLGPEVDFSLKTPRGSTGQQQVAEIQSLQGIQNAVLLLDEWDANLDRSNIERIDAFLGTLSKENLIIETRHRLIQTS